jgi:thiol-disulfide isomerase/thioredoxin
MWVLSMVAAHAANPPVVQVEWRKEKAHASILAPEGEKIGLEAPGKLSLQWSTHTAELGGDGAQISRGLELGDLRGAALQGTLEVALCDLAGTTCRPTSWVVSGNVPSAKKGSVTLLVAAPAAETHPSPFGAGAVGADEVFARARQSGKLVLLDFSAVWCPPCNMLADEVLHEDPPELEAFEVAVLDVDHPSSFALKERYGVGGYPTVVVVDAEGNEKSRTVGYENAEAFLAWLVSAPQSTDGADLAKDPSQVDPVRAAALARRKLAEGDEDGARSWFARAETAPDEVKASSVDLHLVRFALDKAPTDLQWLLKNAPGEAMDYVGTAVELHEKHPEEARQAVNLALREARGAELADALSYAAMLAGDESAEARTLNSAAVSAVRSAMTGEPDHDKGYISWLAHLLEQSGDREGVVALLTDATAQWPQEPTFYNALASRLLRFDRKEEALAAAERAVSLSWGDNRLVAAATQAEVLVALGRAAEAARLAQTTLAAQPAPAETQVRTHRYRTKLEAFVHPPTANK